MRSISRRIFVSLAITTVVTSLFAYAWVDLQARSTEQALRERALLEQANLIVDHLTSGENGAPALDLPKRLSDAYARSAGSHRFAVRDQNEQLLFGSGPEIGPIPSFGGQLTQTVYDYDPDGPGPVHMFGAAVKTVVSGQTLIIQVEETGLDDQYRRAAINQEFLSDGGWLQAPFLFAWLGVSMLAVRRALAPINRVSRVAENIDPATPDTRLPAENVPTEILPLVNAINRALDRLEHGLMRQREFNADAAHQLRTPLAVLSAN